MKGHIRNRGKNKYQLVVTIGSDYKGKPIRYYRTVDAKSYKEAEEQLVLFYGDCMLDRAASANGITFREFAEIWENEYASINLKHSTLVVHKRNLKANFTMLNDKKLNTIKPFHVAQWIAYLKKEKGLSAKTIRNNYSLLHSILQKAVVWEYISKNPADNVDLPKCENEEADYYNDEEVMELLVALDKVPDKYINYKIGVLIALFGGLRRGEIFGLDEKDVDFEMNTIRIRQTRMTYGGVGIYVDTPKTKKSKRTITMPAFVIAEIEDLIEYNQIKKEENKLIWQDSEALLKNEIGNPLYPKSLLRWFSKFLKKNDMRHISIKGLRHTHVAMTRSLGSSLEEASRRVGHSQYGTTLNIYDHIFKNSTDFMIAMGLEEKYGKPVSDTNDDKTDVL